MRINDKSLALRDPAYAAAIGAIGDDFGVDFGYNSEFGDDWGAEMAQAQVAIPAPTKEQALQAYSQQYQQRAMVARRQALLEPNKGSPLKIEKYSISLSQSLTLGTTVAISANQNPNTNFRCERPVANSPQPGFVTLSGVQVANVNALTGDVDTFMWNALAQGTGLSLPTLTPANRVTITGTYTGFVPSSYVGGATYTWIFSLVGYASMVA